MTTPTKIYRGGIPNTTAITHEAILAVAAGTVKPGTIVKLGADAEYVLADAADVEGVALYVVGEQMYGNIDDDLNNATGTISAYELQSGHLYAVRSAGDVVCINDAAVSLDAGKAADGATAPSLRLFVDTPASAQSDLTGTTPADGALIPVKFI